LKHDKSHLIRQVTIIHISDIHFGNQHRFLPELTPMKDRPAEIDYPSLAESFLSDLSQEASDSPLVICATGDFAQTCDVYEFQQAEAFFQKVFSTKILGRTVSNEDLFIVPGNHDVTYENSDVGVRFQQYTEFHNRLYDDNVRRENPWDFCRVYDRVESHGAIIACLNSSIYVQKESPEQDRGYLDIKQLTRLEEALEAIDRDRLKSAIRIALVHHHPVLIPQLAEPSRGYDAIQNSGKFLTILKRFGFHAVLHGHKHNPHTFTDDTRAAHVRSDEGPIFFSCAGSIGSKALPQGPDISNCYNRITIKWHPGGDQFRVKCITRGLLIYNKDGSERLPTRWNWYDMRICDRHFIGNTNKIALSIVKCTPFNEIDDRWREECRIKEYERLRGYLPVVEVRPSLVQGQAYEAVVWIAKHPPERGKNPRKDAVKVIWSAGKRFGVQEVSVNEKENFAVSFDYWGPMLIQADIVFADGEEAFAHVYAHLPVGDIVSN
jgi:Calcineurin-like phosphoesterase/prokaryotic YEATS domain